jgi:5-methyltetrahydrofolate--homocysteine methyltransferase
MSDLFQQISGYLQQGDDEKVGELVQKAINEKHPAKTILDNGLIAGMNIIGEQFKNHEIFLPEVLLAARAMYAGLDLLKPLFIKEEVPSLGKVIIGTVHGDLHDLGKNLVGIMLKGAGFDVIDLGKDIPAEAFVNRAVEENARIIGMSALLTTTMPEMRKVVDLVKERGLQDSIKTIVGGAPLSDDTARQFGADAYAYDAANAVEKVKELLK